RDRHRVSASHGGARGAPVGRRATGTAAARSRTRIHGPRPAPRRACDPAPGPRAEGLRVAGPAAPSPARTAPRRARCARRGAPAAGAPIAAAARPTAERDGVLTITCAAATWAQELDLMASQLIPRLNAELHREAVRELRCRTG